MHRARLSEITGQGSEPSSRLEISEEEARILEAWLEGPTTSRSVVARARIIRAASAGLSNSEIARHLGVSRGTVILWRRRFEREGLLSLTEVRPGRGRRPTVSLRAAREILRSSRRRRLSRGFGTSYESQAAAWGMSAATVYRAFDAHGVARRAAQDGTAATSHPVLVGVYLDPPDHAIVLAGSADVDPAVSEMHMPRALLRVLARFERRVVGLASARDRERAFLKFLRRAERATGGDTPLRLLVDAAGGVYERPAVDSWLRAHRHRVFPVDVASTSRLFAIGCGLLGQGRIGAGAGVARLTEDLRGFLSTYDGEPDRFVWLAVESLPPGAS